VIALLIVLAAGGFMATFGMLGTAYMFLRRSNRTMMLGSLVVMFLCINLYAFAMTQLQIRGY
jgi:hypothetical protein